MTRHCLTLLGARAVAFTFIEVPGRREGVCGPPATASITVRGAKKSSETADRKLLSTQALKIFVFGADKPFINLSPALGMKMRFSKSFVCHFDLPRFLSTVN